MERKRLHLRPYVGDKEINDHQYFRTIILNFTVFPNLTVWILPSFPTWRSEI